MKSFPLPEKQKQVVLPLVNGASHSDMAGRLNVGINADIHSGSEMIEKLSVA